MEYHIRYTCSGELQAQIVDFITRNANKYIIAKEFATREHIQVYVETNVTKKTWVNKFNLKFKNMDRRDKYVEPDKGRTKIYVCKGVAKDDVDIIAKRGFTDNEIIEFNHIYWNEVDDTIIISPVEQVNVSPASELKEKKKPKPTFMKQIRQELEELYPDKEWELKDKPIVFMKVMFNLGEGCKNLDHIIISRMTYGVLNSLIKNKKEWLEYWYKKAFGGEYLYETIETDMSLDE